MYLYYAQTFSFYTQEEQSMRIIAGIHGSRRLETLKGNNTRPTTDKVKEAIFSRIGPYFDGGNMLDLFSGSGSMGLEAISRGMESCYLIDKDFHAISVIKQNIANLKVEKQCHVMKTDAVSALRHLCEKQVQFDMIFVDPPYVLENIYQEVMDIIYKGNLLSHNGHLVLESAKEVQMPSHYENFELKKEATYGICKISYYRMKEESIDE